MEIYYQIKSQIEQTIRNKKIDTIILANNLNISHEKFQNYMNTNNQDLSIYIKILKEVKSWE